MEFMEAEAGPVVGPPDVGVARARLSMQSDSGEMLRLCPREE